MVIKFSPTLDVILFNDNFVKFYCDCHTQKAKPLYNWKLIYPTYETVSLLGKESSFNDVTDLGGGWFHNDSTTAFLLKSRRKGREVKINWTNLRDVIYGWSHKLWVVKVQPTEAFFMTFGVSFPTGVNFTNILCRSFYTRRSQKQKNDCQVISSFGAFVFCACKSFR